MLKRTILAVAILMLALFNLSNLNAQQITYEEVNPAEVDAGMPYNVKAVPVTDPSSLSGVRIAIIAAHGFEEIEATYPIEHMTNRGAIIEVITPDWIKDRVMAVKFLRPSIWIPVTRQISQAKVEDYHAIIIPGGAWNPIIMRTDAQILDFVKKFHASGKLVASVCHGPQVLLSAGLVKGRKITGVGDIRQDLRNAGAVVIEDQNAVVDGNIITSRDPNDLAFFSTAIEKFLKNAARSEAIMGAGRN